MAADPLSANTMNSQKGVTLIELMVVVVIIGILAAIAYPSYRAQVMRSHRSDAKIGLERLAQALERCYTNAMPKTYAGCIAASTPSENGYYTITTGTADATSFSLTATAVGGQLADTDCRTFTLTNTNARTAATATSTDNSAACWQR
jgi:type IV pilus assembly protein PilE